MSSLLGRFQRFARGPGNLTLLALIALGCWLAPKVASGPHLFDAGELAEAAVALGGSHPPGQPLHALLAHPWLWLPLGTMAARLALFSLLTTLCAAAALSALTHELLDALGIDELWRELAKASAAASLVLADPVLRQALRIEVYGLALALTLISSAWLVRWARHADARALLAGALAAGLCASTHPPQAGCAVLLGVALVVVRPALLKPRAIAWAAAFCVAGLLPYAYLSVRARAGAPMWGAPATLTGLLEYVTARAYSQNIAYGGAEHSFLGNALIYTRYLIVATWGVPFVALALLFLRRELPLWLPRALALAMLLGMALSSMQSLQETVPDHVAYAAPALALALALGVAGVTALAGGTSAFGTSARAWSALAALACFPIASAAHARTQETLRADLPLLETLTHALVETPAARALVVATTDFTGASWMMERAIDRARPDTALFIAGLSTSSWHWASLATHPAFDGKPQRGPGRDAHQRFLNGAIAHALQRVPVALERDASVLLPYAIRGAYTELAPLVGGAPSAVPEGRVDARSIGERLEHVIASELAASPGGDSDAAHSIARDHFLRRAERLLRIGRATLAMQAVRAATPFLPQRERAQLKAERDGAGLELPPIVAEPRAFLFSRDYAVRFAATALWALRRPEPALALLEAQLTRGDARSVLQLCTLQAASDGHAQALECVLHFERVAPELAGEAAPLLRALQNTTSPSPQSP